MLTCGYLLQKSVMCTEYGWLHPLTLLSPCNTLQLYMKHHNIHHQYSMLSNADLDILTRRFQEKKPESGLCYLIGFLHRHGLRVQWWQVVSSLRWVDRIGQILHQRRVIFCCKYTVKRPDALWHVDGHHKLIQGGVVIHRMVDGFSQMVNDSCFRLVVISLNNHC